MTIQDRKKLLHSENYKQAILPHLSIFSNHRWRDPPPYLTANNIMPKKVKIKFRLQGIYRKHIDYANQIINNSSIKHLQTFFTPEDEDQEAESKYDDANAVIFEITYNDEIELAKKCVVVSSAFNGICSEEHGEAGDACYLEVWVP